MSNKLFKLSALWCIGALFVFSACKKDGSTDKPTPAPTGMVRPAGEVDNSDATSELIGPKGGKVESVDGRLTIEVPAGALTSEYLISIQRISNTNPLGRGLSYRVNPHYIPFNKEVKLTYKYGPEDLHGTVANALGIAYQDAKGVWQAVGGAVLDESRKTVSITTNHFSDWSLFVDLELAPTYSTIEPGGTVELSVIDALLAPLGKGKDGPIGYPLADKKLIKKWTLIGPGSLAANGNKAVYKAPAKASADDEATVSVELDMGRRGQFILLAHILIVDSYIQLSVGGTNMRIPADPAIKFQNMVQVTSLADNGYGDVRIHFTEGLGQHNFQADGISGAYFGFWPKPQEGWVCFYYQDNKSYISGGGIQVSDMGEKSGYVEGTIAVHPSGYVKENVTNVTPSVNIVGSFRVKRWF